MVGGSVMDAITELKQHPNWVCWKRVIRDPRKKATKMPVDPVTGRAASSTNPTTWTSYDLAKVGHNRFRTSGLGWVFSEEVGIIGIDIDNCVKDGRVDPQATMLIKSMSSYCELSPSGNGVHVFVRGTIPHSFVNGDLEVYNKERYFTVTGKRVLGTPDTINRADEQLKRLFDLNAKKRTEPVKHKTNFHPQTVDEERIKDALKYIPQKQAYLDWVACLSAIHSWDNGHRGVSIAESWSPGYDGEVRRIFNSMSRNEYGNNIAYIFKRAIEFGWQPNRSRFSVGDSVNFKGSLYNVKGVKWRNEPKFGWVCFVDLGKGLVVADTLIDK